LLEQLEGRRLLAGDVKIELYGAYTLDSYAGVGFQENEVATMQAQKNGQADTNKGDFQAQIQWGDGGSSTGDLVYLGTNGNWADYQIKGSHVYQNTGTNIPINLTVTGPDGTSVSFYPNDIDYADVAAMPSGMTGTQPSAGSNSMPPANVQIQLYGAYTLDSYAGVGFQENEVATMQAQVNGQADATLSDFHAQINWGDSATWDSADLVYLGTNGNWADYLIKGSHVYQQPNTNIPIVVYATGPDGTSTAFYPNDIDSADVVAMPSGIPGTQPSAGANSSAPANVQIQLAGAYTLDSYAGVGFQENEVATMQVQVNGQADETLSDFHAQVNWGDSASWDSADLVYMGTNGNWADYLIKGSHVYQKPNTNIPIVVYATGPDGTSTAFYPNDIDSADVVAMPSGIPGTQPGAGGNSTPADVQIQLYGAYTLSSYAGVGFQENEVATMQAQVNGQPDTNVGDFQAQINWGDSASWTGGDVFYQGTSGNWADYIIKGSHVYQKPGTNIPIVLYVTGPDGTSTTFYPNDIDYADVTPNPNAITVGSLSPTQWQENQPNYDGTISVTGGTGGYQNLQISGLPSGLTTNLVTQTLNGKQIGTIEITGTPTQSGTFTLQVSIQDGNGDSGSATESLTITAASLTVGSLSPAQWTVNQPGYDGTIPVTGGTGGYQNLQIGGLPSGLTTNLVTQTLNGKQIGTIDITGTPTQSGTFTLQVSIADGNGDTGNATESLTITAAPITVGSLSPSDWTVNQPGYDGTIPLSGGSGTYSNLVVTGLPAGLGAELSGSTITVSGTPTESGTFNDIAVSLDDSDGATGNATESLTIHPAVTLGDLTPAEWTVNEPGYDGTIDVNGGTGGYQNMQVTGLPQGLSDALQTTSVVINGQTQQSGTITISGTPTESGDFTVLVSLQDGSGAWATYHSVGIAALRSFADAAPQAEPQQNNAVAYPLKINAANSDLAVTIDTDHVVPSAATDLNLSFFFGKEQLSVPVTISNLGPSPANGAVTVTLSLYAAPPYAPAMSVMSFYSTQVKINLAANASTTAKTLPPLIVNVPTGAKPGINYDLQVQISSSAIKDPDLSNNTASTARTFEFVGTPTPPTNDPNHPGGAKSAFYALPKSGKLPKGEKTLFQMIRDTLNSSWVPAVTNATVPENPSTTQPQTVTEAFIFQNENAGRDYLYAYTTKADSNPTIGIGINLNSVAATSAVGIAFATDVRAYYAANYSTYYQAHLGQFSILPPGFTKLPLAQQVARSLSLRVNAASIISLVKAQGTANQHKDVITLTDEWTLFRLKLNPYASSTYKLFIQDGGVWDNVTAQQYAAMVDVNYNTGSNFSHMVQSVASGDIVSAVFNLVNAARTTQVLGLNIRTEADLQMLVFSNVAALGQIVH